MAINIDTVKIETIDYIDDRLYRYHKDGLRDFKKLVSVTFNTNSILVDVLKNLLKYDSYIKVKYYKGKNSDTLFVKLTGTNHSLIKIFNRYNTILNGVTYSEKNKLDYIRNNSYISKKYSINNVTDDIYGVYEPIYNQTIFKTKRINYEKIKIEEDIISKTLKNCCQIITESNPNIEALFVKIFEYRLKICSFKLHNNYHRVQENYDNYQDFIKSVVYYGATHYNNNNFWRKIKRELY